jgi:predicted P-loop ATPase/phage/plasmid primase-like uncharacterized protein
MATLDQVLQQMRDEDMPDLPAGHPERDGKIHRFGPKKKAWYKLQEFALNSGEIMITGSFGIWHGAEPNTIRVQMDWKGVSAEERTAAEAKRQDEERKAAERDARKAAAAARRAHFQWGAAAREGSSAYIERKKISAPAVRFGADGVVLIPAVVFGEAGPQLVGLQKIAPDGEKRFNTGMAKQGACCPIGKVGADDALLFLGEGYATARSVSMATDGAIGGYVAFDAGNLIHVARMARARHPDTHILFCADDDYQLERRLHDWLLDKYKVADVVPVDGAERTLKAADGMPVRVTASWCKDSGGVPYVLAEVRSGRRIATRKFENAGIASATAAAVAVGNASVTWPRFADRGDNKWTDFNDLHCEESLDQCREQLAAAILRALQPAPEPAAGGDTDPVIAAHADDPLYDAAVKVVCAESRVSISLVQRHLKVGYNRAARLVERMELNGLVSPMGPSGERQLLKPAGNVVDLQQRKRKRAAAAPAAAGGAEEAPPAWAGNGDGQPAGADHLRWEDGLARSDKGGILPSLANVFLILSNHKDWSGVLAYDEFSGQVVKLKAPPFAGGKAGEYSDMDDLRCTLWMQQKYGFQPRKEVVMDAVLLIADLNMYHVVRGYLDPLVWDEVPRLDHWLVSYLGAEDTPYVRAVARKWLISAVARIYKPGCKADNVLILEGEQGLYKSTALKVLGGDWFTDAPFKLGDKDAYAVIRGKWIIELAELDSFNKAESTGAKLFFGQYIDRYRNFYGKRASDVPRQQVFAGTTNSDAYLKDDTGNRRYWPVRAVQIDLEGLKQARDQIWAEAVHRFRAGEEWWPTAPERAMFEEEQDARYVGDEYIRLIKEYLIGKSQTTMADILGNALKLDVAKWSRPEQQRVGRCMSEIGWKRKRDTKVGVDGKRDWLYQRPETSGAAPANGDADGPL